MGSSFRKTYTVKRMTGGNFINGRYVDNHEPEMLSISASVQSASSYNLGIIQAHLPEGKSISDSRILYTSTELKTVNVAENINADIVIINDKEFEVIKCWPNQNGVINHYRVLVAKK